MYCTALLTIGDLFEMNPVGRVVKISQGDGCLRGQFFGRWLAKESSCWHREGHQHYNLGDLKIKKSAEGKVI